ncbi:hypothetical protein GEMRC1_010235 [Eukaryota sp. GEM-RC1]
MVNNTVKELKLRINSLSFDDIASLAEVLSSNSTLQTISFSSFVTLKDEESVLFFTAISNNLKISKIDLYGIDLHNSNSNTVVSLLQSSSLESIKFPTNYHLDSTAVNSLKNNSSLKEITIPGYAFTSEDLADVLQFNTFLKKLEISG